MANWDEIDNEYGNGNFKDYAPNGTHTAKLEKASVIDKENWKSPAVEFTFLEDDAYKYPKSPRHFLSMAKPAWRMHHMRDILMALGMPKETAQKAIETVDDPTNPPERAKMVKGYQAVFDKIAQKHPEVEIIVRTQMRDGKPVCSEKGTPYGESEIAKAAMGQTQTKASAPTMAEDVLGGDEINLNDIPF